MGFWGITMSESDYGLDMLEAIVGIPLKDMDFSAFNMANELEVIHYGRNQIGQSRIPRIGHSFLFQ